MTLTICRAFATELERTSKDTLAGLLVPFGQVADVIDYLPSGPDVYREGFRAGVFGPQIANAGVPGTLQRVAAKHEHEGGINYLGPCIGLDESDAGVAGEFRILPSKRDDVEALIEAGVCGLSIEFHEKARKDATRVDETGVRWRQHAVLTGVALVPRGAYTGARVLAYREEIAEHEAEIAAAKADADAERTEAERIEAEQAEQAKADADAIEQAERERAELDAWIAAENAKQAEIVARYSVDA